MTVLKPFNAILIKPVEYRNIEFNSSMSAGQSMSSSKLAKFITGLFSLPNLMIIAITGITISCNGN